MLITSRERKDRQRECEREETRVMEIGEVPWIFLSHSGKQKEFTRRLYHELVHAGHRPFFDQDAHALPKGHHFPTRIVEACRRCKMGIVVLSHDYMESLWPMLELEQLTFHNSSVLIYPLFYCLQPADLSNPDNLKRWQSRWDKRSSSWPDRVLKASRDLQLTIDMNCWPKAVEMLKYQNGDVLLPCMEDDAYIERIVANICKTLPAPQLYRLGQQFKGMDHMQRDIDVLFQQQDSRSNGVKALGVYGVGGSGKSTLCKSIVNLYSKEFSGRSYWLEFSDQKNENQLVEAIKKVLSTLSGTDNEALQRVSSIEEALSHLEQGLKWHKVFLAIDNLWDGDIETARQILEMEYIFGSRVMVTSRSKQILQLLLLKTVLVPSITKEEALEALLYYSHANSFPCMVSQKDLRRLVQSCFYEEHCHPLLLKAVGDKLKQVAGRMNDGKDWTYFISHVTACHDQAGNKDVEESVLKVLETSFHAMPAQLQKIFIDLVTCVPEAYRSPSFSSAHYEWLRWPHCEKYVDNATFLKECEWLSMLHQGYTRRTMRYEFIQLEYHGLLEIKKAVNRSEIICIHDLYKGVARRNLSKDAACNYFCDGYLSEEGQMIMNLKYARFTIICYQSMELVKLFPKVEVLELHVHSNVRELSVEGMPSLRFFKLSNAGELKEIEGWKRAPNVVLIELTECTSLRNVGDIGSLRKLQRLAIIKGHASLRMPDLTGCHNLTALTLRAEGDNLQRHLADIGQPPKLKQMDFSGNPNLEGVAAVGTFITLQKLDLSMCWSLRYFPDFNLSNLRILDLTGCIDLVSMEGSVCALTSLEELHLTNCWKLRRIPNLKNLARLKVLRADHCNSLGELQMDREYVLNSLQTCDLRGCIWLQCDGDLRNVTRVKLEEILELQLHIKPTSPAAATDDRLRCAFVNLRELVLVDGENIARDCVSLDVSGLVSLDTLYLARFPSVQVISGLGTLHNLTELGLHDFLCLKVLGGLGTLAKLVWLELENCRSLTDLSNLTSHMTSLKHLDLRGCSSLIDISNLASLASSLELLNLVGCSSIVDISNFTSLTSLQHLDLTGSCSHIRDFSSLSTLTSLECLHLVGCSLSPSLTHLYESEPSFGRLFFEPSFKLGTHTST